MPDPIKLELVSLRKIYDRLASPLNLRDHSRPSYSILKPREKIDVLTPLVQSGAEHCPALLDFELSEVSVCFLPNVVITHTGAVIFEDRYLIEESTEGGFANNGLIEKDGSIFFDGNADDSDEIVLNINKYGTFNYSIFTAEILPMALAAGFIAGAEQLKTRIFFPEFMSEQAIELRYELLRICGLSSDRISRGSKAAIRHKGAVVIKINDRYRNHRNSQMLHFTSAAIRGAMANPAPAVHKRIYVSRQAAPSRQITNFVSFEKNILREFGFHAIELDSVPLSDQVNLFSKADVVLAEHGAALINTIFMRPSSIVVEVFPKPMVGRWMYRIISNRFKLNYFFGAFETPADWQWNADKITVPEDLYRTLLLRVGTA